MQLDQEACITAADSCFTFPHTPRDKPKCELTQTERERSLLPTAQQQYGELGLGELPFFCFFLKIFGLNFYGGRDTRVNG